MMLAGAGFLGLSIWLRGCWGWGGWWWGGGGDYLEVNKTNSYYYDHNCLLSFYKTTIDLNSIV